MSVSARRYVREQTDRCRNLDGSFSAPDNSIVWQAAVTSGDKVSRTTTLVA